MNDDNLLDRLNRRWAYRVSVIATLYCPVLGWLFWSNHPPSGKFNTAGLYLFGSYFVLTFLMNWTMYFPGMIAEPKAREYRLPRAVMMATGLILMTFVARRAAELP